MVEFTQNDFKVIITMSLFLIFISFVFPALGFTANNVQTGEIPSFNASQNQFDHLRQPAYRPGNPNSGTLRYQTNAQEFEDKRSIDIAENIGVSTYNAGSPSNPDVRVALNNLTSGVAIVKSINTSEYVIIEDFGYSVSYSNLQFDDTNSSYSVEFTVHERPEQDSDSGGWIDAIPIIGGLISGASELASGVLWIGQLLFTIIANAIITITNIFITLLNTLTFIFKFFYWLLSTYGAIVVGSPAAWVAVFMAIPGLVLSFEFAKIVLLLISIILDGVPFT